jgi:hypothetical protein
MDHHTFQTSHHLEVTESGAEEKGRGGDDDVNGKVDDDDTDVNQYE